MKFVVEGQPQGKERARVSKHLCPVRMYLPKKTVRYQELVFISSIPELPTPNIYYDKALKMRIIAYYKIPKGFNQAKQKDATDGKLRPSTKPDLDNVAKAICDSLNSLVYKDDSQIVSLIVDKYYSDRPRVEVEVEIAD